MFKFKSSALKTKEAMCKAISGDYENHAKEKIQKLTGHNEVLFTNSGNGAIFIALSAVDNDLLVPDQGGWHGFKQIGKYLNKNITQIKTNKGLITEESLVEHNNCTLILTSFAGYTAKQDLKNISKICKENNITLIEDASAGIGDKKREVGNCKYSDIILASTGSPKMINVGSGGFVTTSNPGFLEKIKIPEKLTKPNEIILAGIDSELDFVEKNLELTVNANTYLKNNIDNVIHKEYEGLNTIISHTHQKEFSWKLKRELIIDKKSFITTCPNYNRIKQKAIVIETKNLSYESLTKENLDKIIEISNQQ